MNEPAACPKCSVALVPGEAFCAACGYALEADAGAKAALGKRIGAKYAKQTIQGTIHSGRKTILVCGILFTLGTVVIHFMLSSAHDKTAREIAAAKGDPRYDQALVAQAARELEEGRGMATLLTASHAVLAACFYGLWWWAKSRPLPATLTALLLYIAVQLISLALDPETLVKGILVKILILLALGKAVGAAQKYQKLQQQGL
jgi:hypothetical protein